MGQRSFYDVLEVRPQARQLQIKEAFRRLALQRHPDKNSGKPGAVAAFQEVSALFESRAVRST